MKRLLQLSLVALVLVGTALGCGGSHPRGINKDKDRPKPAEPAPEEPPPPAAKP